MATAMRLLRSEIHPDYTRIEEIINIFVSLGFTRFSIYDETDVYMLTIAMPITDDELGKMLVIYLRDQKPHQKYLRLEMKLQVVQI